MRWLFYNILFTIGFLCLLPKYLFRMHRRGGYRKHFGQRLARYSPSVLARLRAAPRPVWIHAVSVGEVFVAFKLIDELRRRAPDTRFVLTVTTSTAHAIATKQIAGGDVLLYFPVDFAPVARRAVRIIHPRALVLVEAEYWPNLLRNCGKLGIPVSLVNGRVSDSSFRGYRRLIGFTRSLLPRLAPVCVQGARDAGRLKVLGADPTSLHVVGSVKYEVDPPADGHVDLLKKVLDAVGMGEKTRILLGGSTWPGEEQALLETYRELKPDRPDLALVLVPRHVERSPDVVRAIEQAGLSLVCRSQVDPSAPSTRRPDVLLVDTTGELALFYACADVVFVGKSLTCQGGQNPIEPAVCGRAILTGPHMENFPVILQDFLEARALLQVADGKDLTATVRTLLDRDGERLALGERAAALVRNKRGAVAVTADLLQARWDA